MLSSEDVPCARVVSSSIVYTHMHVHRAHRYIQQHRRKRVESTHGLCPGGHPTRRPVKAENCKVWIESEVEEPRRR